MVIEKLCSLLAEQLGLSVNEITPDSNIVEDLGADSLDVAELIATLEDEFDIIITDDRIRELYTVKEVAAFVESLL